MIFSEQMGKVLFRSVRTGSASQSQRGIQSSLCSSLSGGFRVDCNALHVHLEPAYVTTSRNNSIAPGYELEEAGRLTAEEFDWAIRRQMALYTQANGEREKNGVREKQEERGDRRRDVGAGGLEDAGLEVLKSRQKHKIFAWPRCTRRRYVCRVYAEYDADTRGAKRTLPSICVLFSRLFWNLPDVFIATQEVVTYNLPQKFLYQASNDLVVSLRRRICHICLLLMLPAVLMCKHAKKTNTVECSSFVKVILGQAREKDCELPPSLYPFHPIIHPLPHLFYSFNS